MTVEELGKKFKAGELIFVATAYWCDDFWPICAGRDEARVREMADAYINDKTPGRQVEAYFVNRIPFFFDK